MFIRGETRPPEALCRKDLSELLFGVVLCWILCGRNYESLTDRFDGAAYRTGRSNISYMVVKPAGVVTWFAGGALSGCIIQLSPIIMNT